jgi:hypothetical protein
VTDAAYVFAGYGLSSAVLAGYAAWVIARRRSLARALGRDGPPPRAPRPASPASPASPE